VPHLLVLKMAWYDKLFTTSTPTDSDKS